MLIQCNSSQRSSTTTSSTTRIDARSPYDIQSGHLPAKSETLGLDLNRPLDKPLRTCRPPEFNQNVRNVSPVAVDWSETFAALRQGVIDGQENPYSVINTFQLYKANQKYLTDSGHFFDILVFAVSKKMMDGLSAEDQAAIREAGRLATLEQRKLAAEEDEKNLEDLKASGMEVTELTDEQRAAFQTATRPVYALIGETLGQDKVDAFVAAVDAAK